jgi:hypothetical protein
MAAEIREAFERADFAQIVRLMDQHFGESNYSLRSLFRDEQRKVLNQIMATTREEVYNSFRIMRDRYVPLLRFLGDLGAPAPPALRMAVHFVLNSELRQQFEAESMDVERVRQLLADVEREHAPLESDALAYALMGQIERLSVAFENAPDRLELLRTLAATALLARELPFEVNLWKSQNIYFRMMRSVLPGMRARARGGGFRGGMDGSIQNARGTSRV